MTVRIDRLVVAARSSAASSETKNHPLSSTDFSGSEMPGMPTRGSEGSGGDCTSLPPSSSPKKRAAR